MSLKFKSELPPLIIYHDHCLDGFTAAFVTHEAMIKMGDISILLPDSYSTGLCTMPIEHWPVDPTGRDIYIVDFSYPPEVLEALCNVANDVVVLDHHESAITKLNKAYGNLEDLPTNLSLILNQSLSGAGLDWQYFNCFDPIPELVRYVQDRDLWQFRYEETKPFCAALGNAPKTLDAYRLLLNPVEVQNMIHEGCISINIQEAQMRSIIKNVRECLVAGHIVPVVNCPGYLASETGNKIMNEWGLGIPFSATYFDGPTHRHWSLRSLDEAEDVRVIAESFGGGGHRNAAGFTTALGYSFPPVRGGRDNEQD